MPLTVENGEMPEGANSYASVDRCDVYHDVRGSEEWRIHYPEADEPDPNLAKKEAALLRATDYLNGLAWYGKRAAPGRVMAWPRKDVTDNDGYEIAENLVPENVVLACCYLAGVIYAGADAQPVLARGGRTSSESVGSLSESYFDDAANRDIYSAVADLLHGLAYGFDRFAGVGDNEAGKGKAIFGKAAAG